MGNHLNRHATTVRHPLSGITVMALGGSSPGKIRRVNGGVPNM
jgi:hypothetical protein